MPAQPEISFIIPVYNKADVLPFVLRALQSQQLAHPVEYIFVDDASEDGSADLLEILSADLPKFLVLRNQQNAGPAVRINQGVRRASGRLLCLIDADELIAPDAVSVMARLLEDERAQMIHGKVASTATPAAEVIPFSVGSRPDYRCSGNPLEFIVTTRGIVRMAWLVETTLFRAAGGCDERLFIQDEALPLRLGQLARRMIDLTTPVLYAPQAETHLSADQRQQHHDRFFAYYYMIHDHPDLSAEIRRHLMERCISTAWKAVQEKTLPYSAAKTLFTYFGMKIGLLRSPLETIEEISAVFGKLPRIRRSTVTAMPGGLSA